MKKCIIGVVPLVDYGKKSWWMLPGYMEGILEAGGLPVMLSFTEDREAAKQSQEMLDGLLFTGGQDVSPEVYGEERLSCCKECSPERDRMERLLLEGALHRGHLFIIFWGRAGFRSTAITTRQSRIWLLRLRSWLFPRMG